MSYKNSYWTIKDLIDKEGKSSKQIKNEVDDKAKKFKEILKRLGLSDKIRLYRSDQSNSGGGYYIFWGEKKDEAKGNLNKLINLFFENDKEKDMISIENMNTVIEILCDLLPLIKDEEKIKILQNELRPDMKKFILLLDEMKNLKIFRKYSDKTRKTKSEREIEKILHMLDKIDQSEIISEYRTENINLNFNNKLEIEIAEAVKSYFLSRMNEIYFEDISAEKGNDKKRNRNFYQEQYFLIKGWYIKWLSLISNIDELINVEDFYNAYEIFRHYETSQSDIEKYFRTGVWPDNKLEDVYQKYYRLCTGLLSSYWGKNLTTETMKEMINYKKLNVVSIENLSDKNINGREDYISFCGKLVEDIRSYESKKSGKINLRNIVIEAFKELEFIVKKAQDDTSEREKYERAKMDFVKLYGNFHRVKEPNKIFLEIIFDLKYGRKKSLFYYIPYGPIIEELM